MIAPYKTAGSVQCTPFGYKSSSEQHIDLKQMFVNGVEVISDKLEHISLDIQKNMQPKSNERPPICPSGKVPMLHLTPTNSVQKRSEKSSEGSESPWLLKPKHEIPATPPPQADPQAFFPQRIG